MPITWHSPARIYPNRTALAFLEKQASKLDRNERLWAIDEFELHSHPDLSERLLQVFLDPEAVPVAAYGVACIAHPNGLLVGLAPGMSTLFMRLDGPAELTEPAPEIGGAWFRVSAWPPDLSMADGTAAVIRLAGKSWAFASLGAIAERPPLSGKHPRRRTRG